MQDRKKLVLLTLIALVAFSIVSCDTVSKLANRIGGAETTPPAPTARPVETSSLPILERELSQHPFSLISDRLTVQMPVGTEDVARQQGIMSAAQSNRGETRLMLEGNGQTVVLYAKEAFYLVDDLETEADAIMNYARGKGFAYHADPVREVGNGTTLLSYTPHQIDTSSEAVLIRGALIRTGEGALITVDLYVTPDTYRNEDACLKLADDVMMTLQPGARKLALTAHNETIETDIQITLDNGYALIPQFGVDFAVYYIQKITKLGEPAPGIGIYFGGHPSPMYAKLGEGNKLNDKILGKSMEWSTYSPSDQNKNFCAEALLNLNTTTKVHIFVRAADEAEFNQIREMLKTLKRK